MKFKTLRKKIRRLEARLQKGAKKLTKLKQKLEAAATAAAGKIKRKSAARAGEPHWSVTGSGQTQKKKGRVTAKAQSKPAVAEKRTAATKVKRKLNLSPERRAQLAAAIKARWPAKRAAAEATPQKTSTNQILHSRNFPSRPSTDGASRTGVNIQCRILQKKGLGPELCIETSLYLRTC
jgi:hypothetical protein